jgi:putative membrane protein
VIPLAALPALNAALNGLSALLLVTGYFFIRRGRRSAHKVCMIAAFSVSGLFLVSYLILHIQVGATAFSGAGWARPLYYGMLVSHILLAASIVPLASITLYRGLRSRFGLHRRLARRTLPIWIYVSVTGVLIYLMLYRLFPPAGIALLSR